MKVGVRLPLFVFGTLRKDRENHHYLAGRYDTVTAASLPGYERIAPLMIAPRPGGVVDGELYELTASIYAETLAGCDQLEELDPGDSVGPDYERAIVTVDTERGPIEAYAYVQSRRARSVP